MLLWQSHCCFGPLFAPAKKAGSTDKAPGSGVGRRQHTSQRNEMQIRSLQNFVFPVVCAALTACGGGGSDESAYQRALSMADAKEVEARQLAVDTPCDQVSQCDSVGFTDPRDPCGMWSFKPYSLVSSTAAAAKAASDQQRELAAQARKLSPQPDVACLLLIKVPPVLACIASKCQAAATSP